MEGNGVKMQQMPMPATTNGFKLSSSSISSSSSSSSPSSDLFNKDTLPFSSPSSSSEESTWSAANGRNVTKRIVLSSNNGSLVSVGTKMLLSSSSLTRGDDSVLWSSPDASTMLANTTATMATTHDGNSVFTSTSSNRSKDVVANGEETNGSPANGSTVQDDSLVTESGADGSAIEDESGTEKNSDGISLADTTVFSVPDVSGSDVPRSEADSSARDYSNAMSAEENSVNMFGETPAANRAREKIVSEADSSVSIWVPETQPVDSETDARNEVQIVLESDEDQMTSPASSAHEIQVDYNDSDILVPATQPSPQNPTDPEGPTEIEESRVESFCYIETESNATFTVSPSPMKVSTKQLVRSGKNIPLKLASVSEENTRRQPFNSTFVLEKSNRAGSSDGPRNRTFSRDTTPVSFVSSTNTTVESAIDATMEPKNSTKEEPTLVISAPEGDPVDQTKPEDEKNHSPAEGGPEKVIKSQTELPPISAVPALIESSITTDSTSYPRRRKKSYVEPSFPIKPADQPIQSVHSSDSEEEVDGEGSLLARYPFLRNQKRAKAEREALFEVENPVPSTSAALVRHNAREKKKAKTKVKSSKEADPEPKKRGRTRAAVNQQPSNPKTEATKKPKLARKAPKKKKETVAEETEVAVSGEKDAAGAVCQPEEKLLLEVNSSPVPSSESTINNADEMVSATENTIIKSENSQSHTALEDKKATDQDEYDDLPLLTRISELKRNAIEDKKAADPDEYEDLPILTTIAQLKPLTENSMAEEPPVLDEIIVPTPKKKGRTAKAKGRKKKPETEEEIIKDEQVPSPDNNQKADGAIQESSSNKKGKAVPRKAPAKSARGGRKRKAAATVTVETVDEPNGELEQKKLKDVPDLVLETEPLPPTPLKNTKTAGKNDPAVEPADIVSSRARTKRNRKPSTDDNTVAPPEAKRSRKGTQKKPAELKISDSPLPPTPPRMKAAEIEFSRSPLPPTPPRKKTAAELEFTHSPLPPTPPRSSRNPRRKQVAPTPAQAESSNNNQEEEPRRSGRARKPRDFGDSFWPYIIR